jgi:UDP-N-acetylmuramate dehydrogenase
MRSAVATTIMSDDMQGITVLENEPMARHTSWRAGGPARRYIRAASLDALAQYLSVMGKDEKLLWLGLGSNLLVRDGGFDGTVIATQGIMNQLELIDNDSVHVGAGVSDAKLARFCDRHGLAGAEFFAGIPGLVGGALAMNAGAWGGETWPLVVSVETIDHQGVIRTRSREDFEVAYRHVSGPKGEWFVSATLKLKAKNHANDAIDIKQLLAKRAETQPTGVASCGSVFRNPPGDHAARLIEACGLKGKRIGGAVISDKHANFIINDRGATASDIESLISMARESVRKQFGIDLQTEVKIVGEESKRS